MACMQVYVIADGIGRSRLLPPEITHNILQKLHAYISTYLALTVLRCFRLGPQRVETHLIPLAQNPQRVLPLDLGHLGPVGDPAHGAVLVDYERSHCSCNLGVSPSLCILYNCIAWHVTTSHQDLGELSLSHTWPTNKLYKGGAYML